MILSEGRRCPYRVKRGGSVMGKTFPFFIIHYCKPGFFLQSAQNPRQIATDGNLAVTRHGCRIDGGRSPCRELRRGLLEKSRFPVCMNKNNRLFLRCPCLPVTERMPAPPSNHISGANNLQILPHILCKRGSFL